jgi:8-oxo-dGTP pyrophosphatase MutT (NUDIX family)
MGINKIDYAVNARKGYSPVFNGTIGQVLQNSKGKEYYRRSPGVRAIIPTETGLIFQREKREYLPREWDYRLPGGKVADTLLEYLNFLEDDGRDNASNMHHVRSALVKELEEEIGLVDVHFEHIPYHISESSATVEHVLYYYVIEEFKKGKPRPNQDEKIEMVEFSYQEVYEMLIKRKFSEDRTRAVLLEYLLKYKAKFIFS